MTDTKGENTTKNNSQATTQNVDSLLPPASIHIFSDDLETLNLFHALGEDWRFGRINIGIRGDNLDEAIEHYSRRKSPTLIIVQTENTDTDFQNKLADLASVCDEGTAAIVIGPVNDVQLYRHLTGMGISDYLVAPIETENVIGAIAQSLQDIVGAVDSHLMAFVGVNGGVGTTCVSAMISDILANDMGTKTLVMDASGAYSTLWNHFGFSPSGTLIEAARSIVDKDDDAFKRLIIKKSDNLHIINSGAEDIFDNPVATQAYEMLLDHCLSLYPYVIIDTSGAPTQIKRMILARANTIGITTTPCVTDLSLTKLIMKGLKSLPGMENKSPLILLNKTGISKSLEISKDDVKEALETDNIINLPWNADMFMESENNGKPLSSHNDFTTYKSLLLPQLIKITGLKDFDNGMNKQMSGGLSSILSKIMGGSK